LIKRGLTNSIYAWIAEPGGATNKERFEQVRQSSVRQAFEALEDNICNLSCNTSGCQTGTIDAMDVRILIPP
jgi:hypothetical protein